MDGWGFPLEVCHRLDFIPVTVATGEGGPGKSGQKMRD